VKETNFKAKRFQMTYFPKMILT